MPQRATLSFQVSNPLGAADLLLHGETSCSGWGQSRFPTSTLLYVRGFDPRRRSVQVRGEPALRVDEPAFSAFRTPVTLTAMMRVRRRPDARAAAAHAAARSRPHSARGRSAGADAQGDVRQRRLMNPMAQILRQSDTLELTGPQADSLATMNRAYTIRLDSSGSPVAKYFAALPQHYDQGEAYRRYKRGARSVGRPADRARAGHQGAAHRGAAAEAAALVASHLDTRYLAAIRTGTAGGGGANDDVPRRRHDDAWRRTEPAVGAGTRPSIIRQ